MVYKNYIEAYQAAQELKKQYLNNEMLISVEASAYGGFLVRVIPAGLSNDLLLNGMLYGKSKQSNQYQA